MTRHTARIPARIAARVPYGRWAEARTSLATALRAWWARSAGGSPPAPGRRFRGIRRAWRPARSRAPRTTGPTTLWRMRTTVDDIPGSLAALCAAIARLRADILTLQTHPLSEGTVDEFLLRTPAELSGERLRAAVTAAGGRDTWLERADTHDLVDLPTRMLSLATKTALDAAELPLALRRLFGRCTIRSVPAAPSTSPGHPGQAAQDDSALPDQEDVLDGTTMRLRDRSSGGSITVSRPYLPFTPSEFARARALVELDARLGPRVPGHRHVLSLPATGQITVRRAGPEDFEAALALHERCSPETLKRRYHGPVLDADRYLTHLLSPRYGRTLAVESNTGHIIALAHLLWDGDETEVALLVEDGWQRRGIGQELLRELVAMAREASCDSVYAITQSDNTGMVAAMRRLGLPLDYQVEDGTLVITASLAVLEDISASAARS